MRDTRFVGSGGDGNDDDDDDGGFKAWGDVDCGTGRVGIIMADGTWVTTTPCGLLLLLLQVLTTLWLGVVTAADGTGTCTVVAFAFFLA